MNDLHSIIDTLLSTRDASDEALAFLIDLEDPTELREAAVAVRKQYYGTDVYIRGLIEFSNYCKNNCYYCGIRADNHCVKRYRLTEEQILQCADTGYKLGFRTFVLQSGEDLAFTEEILCGIIQKLKAAHPDCAITLSVGEKSKETYRAWFEAGADRYLLRHETATDDHYKSLHPASMRLDVRKQCLRDLREIGYQVGSGFMVGTPGQTLQHLVADLRFLQEIRPDMIGIGPFMPASDTPFADQPAGSMLRTLNLISILRLLFPNALLPATTSLGTIDPHGRELGLQAGANVVMPNLSPVSVRKLYSLYDHKICTGEEAAVCRRCLERRIESVGYHTVVDIGNPKKL